MCRVLGHVVFWDTTCSGIRYVLGYIVVWDTCSGTRHVLGYVVVWDTCSGTRHVLGYDVSWDTVFWDTLWSGIHVLGHAMFWDICTRTRQDICTEICHISMCGKAKLTKLGLDVANRCLSHVM